jgi:AcrR family transcriptional regulator
MKKRRYHSEVRQAQAELTKQRILAAAKKLFSQQGFDKATIGGVADLAGVSAPSVYTLYKSKEGLLRELVHSTIFGAEYKALVDKVVTNSDVVESLRTAASITRHVCEAEEAEIGFIRGAAVLSPSLKALEREAEQLRYERQEVLVRRLFEENVVLPEIDFASARDILWSLTSREMYRMMVVERKWSPEKYERWLADTLTKALIKEDAIVAKKRTA